MTHDSFAVSKEVLRAFTAETGYTVKVLKNSGDAGATVNQAILTKDHPVADALFGLDNTFLSRALDADLFTPYASAALGSVPQSFRAATDGRVTPIDYADVCVDYDAAWFGHDGRPDPPESLADLVDPRYKDLTVVENASTSSPGLAFLLATIVARGRGELARLLDAVAGERRARGVGVGRGVLHRLHRRRRKRRPPHRRVVRDRSRGRRRVLGGHEDTPSVAVLRGVVLPAGRVRRCPPARATIRRARVRCSTSCFRGGSRRTCRCRCTCSRSCPAPRIPDVFDRWAARPAHPLSMDPARIGSHRDQWIQQWTEVVLR